MSFCRQISARKMKYTDKPPYSAAGCAFQTRKGRDGRMYVSQPNNLGQYVWVLAPVPRLQQARQLARQYAPLAAEKAAKFATRRVYESLLPGHPYDNVQTIVQGRAYYDAYY